MVEAQEAFLQPPGTDGGEKVKTATKRQKWTNQLDFLLAVIGSCAGLGNVWRFPYLCYKNGGGAFLLPYLISVLLGGIPMFLLEVSIGQFMSAGGMKAWKIVPIFQGIGAASAVVVFLMNLYYAVILAWALHYLWQSFFYLGSKLPWASCENTWNTESCSTRMHSNVTNVTSSAYVVSNVTRNASGSALSIEIWSRQENGTLLPPTLTTDAVTEYWERKVLGISSGIDDLGNIRGDLAICLFLAWVIVYLCIFKGVKLSGKVIYFTATCPYLLMTIILVRAATLPGAVDGILYYITPNFDDLAKPSVWAEAGTQIVYSYSISMGTLTALGSFNKFNHNCVKDTLVFSLINTVICFFAGIVVFATLGFMAKEHGVAISDVAEQGPGLAFVTYPKAVANMPVSHLWSILFFVMIFLLGLDSQFTCVEGFVTAVTDLFPNVFNRQKRREIFVAFTCVVSFIIGLPFITNGGMYVFQLFDYYTANTTFPLITFCECVAISWLYGIGLYFDHLRLMIGRRIPGYFKVLWVVLTPLFTCMVFVSCVIAYSEPTYNKDYYFPVWSICLGWVLSLCSFMMIPAVAVFVAVKTLRSNKAMKTIIRGELTPQQRGLEA